MKRTCFIKKMIQQRTDKISLDIERPINHYIMSINFSITLNFEYKSSNSFERPLFLPQNANRENFAIDSQKTYCPNRSSLP